MIKNALIIGGTGGIGSAIVKKFSNKGIKIFATYHNSEVKAHQAENLHYFKCDLTKQQDVDSLISYIIKNEVNIDTIINCVSDNLKLKLFEALEIEDFRRDIEVILMGAVRLLHATVPLLKKQKHGVIINIITSAVFDPVPSRMSSYIIAKSGLLGLTKSLSIELKPYGIKVYGLSPYFVETGLIKQFPQKLLELERDKMPDKKFITPDNVAAAVELIISGKFETGENIVILSNEAIKKLSS